MLAFNHLLALCPLKTIDDSKDRLSILTIRHSSQVAQLNSLSLCSRLIVNKILRERTYRRRRAAADRYMSDRPLTPSRANTQHPQSLKSSPTENSACSCCEASACVHYTSTGDRRLSAHRCSYTVLELNISPFACSDNSRFRLSRTLIVFNK